MGMGLECLLVLCRQFPHKDFFYLSLELDEELVCYHLHRMNIPFTKNDNFLEITWQNLRAVILLGNGVQTLLHFHQHHPQMKVDCIFQDAFSPKVNPDLWTEEWFQLIKKFCHPNTIGSTYCSQKQARKNMQSVGFRIFEGGVFGRKKSSTRFSLEKIQELEEIL